MYFLGYDLGSSAVKACLLDGGSGRGVARASYPDREMPIRAPRPGWAEQWPDTWWQAAVAATRRLLSENTIPPGDIGGIGISYQMHGLVLVDRVGAVIRPAIIWCDSRAVDVGEEAFRRVGRRRCLTTLLNSPGNFTAAKLRWVRLEEPEHFDRIEKFLLPGDYLAWKLTGRMSTTIPGLSEGIFWDFTGHRVATFLLKELGIPEGMVPEVVPTFGEQGRLTEPAADELGLSPGTPVSYRAGDQPNNAWSLNVLEPGEIAATAGTSGVAYGVSDTVRSDPRSRVNTFAHVHHDWERARLGVLLCINGAGSSYRWLHEILGRPGYDALNDKARTVPIGSDDLRCYPFGNGAERMLENRDLGAIFSGLAFNRHEDAHLARAVSEGVAFAFQYGMRILGELGIRPAVVRAGLANMFQSPVFRETLASLSGAVLELYDTDGAEGAARGAAKGTGFYSSFTEALEGLEKRDEVAPDRKRAPLYLEAYQRWASELEARLR